MIDSFTVARDNHSTEARPKLFLQGSAPGPISQTSCWHIKRDLEKSLVAAYPAALERFGGTRESCVALACVHCEPKHAMQQGMRVNNGFDVIQPQIGLMN